MADDQAQRIAEFMADPARARLAEQLTQAWQELDAPEGFFDSVPRREYYDFKVPEGDMLHCRTCVEVSFFAAGDSYPFLVIKGSGRIRVPNGVSIRVYPGSYGVAMWTRDKHDDEVMVDRDHREW